MKNKQRIIYGLLITVAIFGLSVLAENLLMPNAGFAHKTLVLQTSMLTLSIAAIFIFRKFVNYKLSLPKFKKILKPILLGVSIPVVVNMLMLILTHALGYKLDMHPAFKITNLLQIVALLFICAPIIEETLFRGFLLNFLKPYNKIGINIFKRKISVPVIISAIAFGLAHLLLAESGVNSMFLIRIALAASAGGIIAGYYQEKYNNHAFAIITHMSTNSLGVLMAIMMSLNA